MKSAFSCCNASFEIFLAIWYRAYIGPTSLNFETHETLQIIQAFDHPLSVSRWGNLGLQLQVHLFSFGCSRPIYRHQVEADIVCHVCFMAPKPISPWIMGGETWFFHQDTLFLGNFFEKLDCLLSPQAHPKHPSDSVAGFSTIFKTWSLKFQRTSKNFASRSNCGSRLTPYFCPLCNARQILQMLNNCQESSWLHDFLALT